MNFVRHRAQGTSSPQSGGHGTSRFSAPGFALAIGLLLSGTVFFMAMEGWSFPDALMYSMSCVSPMGDAGIHPQTDAGKLFSVLYAFVGIGVFVALFSQFARAILRVQNK